MVKLQASGFMKKENLTQVFWEIFKSTFFIEHLQWLLPCFSLFCTSSKTQDFLKAFINIKSYSNFFETTLLFKLTKADTTIITSFKRSTPDIGMVEFTILNVCNWPITLSTCIFSGLIYIFNCHL